MSRFKIFSNDRAGLTPKDNALRVILRKPFFGGVGIQRYFEMIGMTGAVVGIDVYPYRSRWSLFSFCFPQ